MALISCIDHCSTVSPPNAHQQGRPEFAGCLDAIYSEGGITRAAEKLHLTQPAVSHALGRLRTLFDDPLFERDGRLMMPTPKARSLIGTVRRSLRELQIMFNDIERFEPGSSDRAFSVGMRDLLEVSVLPEVSITTPYGLRNVMSTHVHIKIQS